ncbi:MAG: alpha/beta fold hydrolase [Phycisphaerae bacterium]
MQSLRRPIFGFLCGLALAASALADEPKVVSFKTSDGVQISADYFEPRDSSTPAPMAILLHMNRADRKTWRPLIGPLHDAGFAILAIDLRGHGKSGDDKHRKQVETRDTALYEDMQNDVRAAYDFLAAQKGVDRARYALVGASVGCSVALEAAAKDRSLDAVVCMTPGMDYLGLKSADQMGSLTGRKVLMLATADEREAAEKLAKGNSGVSTKIFEGKAHGTAMFGKISGVEEQIARFLKDAVGEPTTTTVYASIERDIYHMPGSGWIERINPSNMRYLSSPEEAEARGLRKARSTGPDDRPGGAKDDSRDGKKSGDDKKPDDSKKKHGGKGGS